MKTVKESFGPLVAETIEKKASSQRSWTLCPTPLPGPTKHEVRLVIHPLQISQTVAFPVRFVGRFPQTKDWNYDIIIIMKHDTPIILLDCF